MPTQSELQRIASRLIDIGYTGATWDNLGMGVDEAKAKITAATQQQNAALASGQTTYEQEAAKMAANQAKAKQTATVSMLPVIQNTPSATTALDKVKVALNGVAAQKAAQTAAPATSTPSVGTASTVTKTPYGVVTEVSAPAGYDTPEKGVGTASSVERTAGQSTVTRPAAAQTVQSAPVQSTPVQSAPVQSTPVQSAPAQTAAPQVSVKDMTDGWTIKVPEIQRAQDNSDLIKALQQAAMEKGLAELQAAYDKNINAIDAAKGNVKPMYEDARNQAAAQAELTRRNWQEAAAAMGLSSGAAGQAALAQNAALQSSLAGLNKAENQDLAQLENQRVQTETDYNNAIAQAQKEGNFELAQALYEEKVRVDEANREAIAQAFQQTLQAMSFNYQVDRDKVADSQWQQEFQRLLNNDKLSADQWTAEFNRLLSRDEVADTQWAQEFKRMLARDEAEDARWQEEFNRLVGLDEQDKWENYRDYTFKANQYSDQKAASQKEQDLTNAWNLANTSGSFDMLVELGVYTPQQAALMAQYWKQDRDVTMRQAEADIAKTLSAAAGTKTTTASTAGAGKSVADLFADMQASGNPYTYLTGHYKDYGVAYTGLSGVWNEYQKWAEGSQSAGGAPVQTAATESTGSQAVTAWNALNNGLVSGYLGQMPTAQTASGSIGKPPISTAPAASASTSGTGIPEGNFTGVRRAINDALKAGDEEKALAYADEVWDQLSGAQQLLLVDFFNGRGYKLGAG